jgi:hypothetical protein
VSSDEIRAALLSKGYFPKELPSVFTTQDFGEHFAAILAEWRDKKVFRMDAKGLGKINKKTRSGSYAYDLKHAEHEIISMPKRGYERRNIHITHPVPQGLLAHEIAISWRSIAKWICRELYSEDEIRISEHFERSIKGINFRRHSAKKSYIEATSDWLVRTDITRFYPSIYTHSIAWAAYGKDEVKGRLNLYKGSLADRLDLLVRACNRNQTVGIPIGPETSRIIAAVLSARLDLAFTERCKGVSARQVDRLQDDWFVGVETLEKAEKILSTIASVYRDFGLDINGTKTTVERIVFSQKLHWMSEIGAFLSHRPGALTGARLREFLSLTLRLQGQSHNEPVVNYALSIVEAAGVSAADAELIESFLLKAAVIAPNSLDRVCRILLNIQFKSKSLSKGRIGKRLIELI